MTHIPDEAVMAPERIRVAQDAEGFWTCREAISGSQEYIRADIAEASISAPCSVEVMELNWVEVSYGFIAHTAFGTYKISVNWCDQEKVAMVIAGGELPKSFHDDTEAAKSAAQADFERRILSCVVTKPVDVAAVRKQAFEEAAKTLDAWGDIYGDNAAACVRSLSAEPS